MYWELGLNVRVHLWSRCDVTFQGTLPKKCKPYREETVADSVSIEHFNNTLYDVIDDFTKGEIGKLKHLSPK